MVENRNADHNKINDSPVKPASQTTDSSLHPHPEHAYNENRAYSAQKAATEQQAALKSGADSHGAATPGHAALPSITIHSDKHGADKTASAQDHTADGVKQNQDQTHRATPEELTQQSMHVAMTNWKGQDFSGIHIKPDDFQAALTLSAIGPGAYTLIGETRAAAIGQYIIDHGGPAYMAMDKALHPGIPESIAQVKSTPENIKQSEEAGKKFLESSMSIYHADQIMALNKDPHTAIDLSGKDLGAAIGLWVLGPKLYQAVGHDAAQALGNQTYLFVHAPAFGMAQEAERMIKDLPRLGLEGATNALLGFTAGFIGKYIPGSTPIMLALGGEAMLKDQLDPKTQSENEQYWKIGTSAGHLTPGQLAQAGKMTRDTLGPKEFHAVFGAATFGLGTAHGDMLGGAVREALPPSAIKPAIGKLAATAGKWGAAAKQEVQNTMAAMPGNRVLAYSPAMAGGGNRPYIPQAQRPGGFYANNSHGNGDQFRPPEVRTSSSQPQSSSMRDAPSEISKPKVATPGSSPQEVAKPAASNTPNDGGLKFVGGNRIVGHNGFVLDLPPLNNGPIVYKPGFGPAKSAASGVEKPPIANVEKPAVAKVEQPTAKPENLNPAFAKPADLPANPIKSSPPETQVPPGFQSYDMFGNPISPAPPDLQAHVGDTPRSPQPSAEEFAKQRAHTDSTPPANEPSIPIGTARKPMDTPAQFQRHVERSDIFRKENDPPLRVAPDSRANASGNEAPPTNIPTGSPRQPNVTPEQLQRHIERAPLFPKENDPPFKLAPDSREDATGNSAATKTSPETPPNGTSDKKI